MLQVSATDDGDPPLSNSSLLTVKLIDVDDIKPQFTHDEYQITLNPNGYQVKHIQHNTTRLTWTKLAFS